MNVKNFMPPAWLDSHRENPKLHCTGKAGYTVVFWKSGGKPEYTYEKLISAVNNGETFEYVFFWKDKPLKNGMLQATCLSQFWKCSFLAHSAFYKPLFEYNCAEQYFMAEKAAFFGDEASYNEILLCETPYQAKKLGRKVNGFDETEWSKVKHSVALNGNYQKFTQNPELMCFLLSTGNKVLVEASPYDKIWGIGKKEDDIDVNDPSTWQGQNMLGFALMEARDEIRRTASPENNSKIGGSQC